MPAKIFLTLYTVQNDWEKDPLGTLEKIREMGYDGVELGIDFEEPVLDAIAAKLKELGLPAVSTHVNLDDLRTKWDTCLSRIKKLGIRYLTIPWLDECRIPGGSDYADTKEFIANLAKKCGDEGIILSYHNHNFEFEKLDGVCKEDILLQDNPSLSAQLDVCWCSVGGQAPAEYIRHYGHRMPTIHLKDYYAANNQAGMKLFDLLGNNDQAEADETRRESGFSFRPVGMGRVDFLEVFKAADEVGVKWMGVEQDASLDRPPMEAAKLSLKYIRENYA